MTTTALAGLGMLVASPVFAACNPAPSNGVTINCGGPNVSTIDASANTNVTVNVGAGASISVGSDAVTVGNGGRVNVTDGGDISTSGGNGIVFMAGGRADILNGGLVSGVVSGINYYGAGGDTIELNINGGTLNGALLGNANSTVTLTDTATLLNPINAGAVGTDTVTLTGTGTTGLVSSDNLQNFDSYTKAGTGTWTISGTTFHDWGITDGVLVATTDNMRDAAISSGATLRFTADSGNYNRNMSGSGTLSVVNGSIMTLSGNNSSFTGTMDIATNNNVTLANANALGGTTQININQSTLTYGTAMTNAANVTIGANDATFDTGSNNVTMSGDIGGATGRLVKAGSGTLTLTGTNTYGDGTYLAGGAVSIGSANSLGTGGIIFDGGALNTTADITSANAITMTSAGTLDVATGTTLTQNGAIGGAGALTKTGAGTLALSAASTNTGLVNINGGTVSVSAANQLGNSGGGNNLTFDGGTLQATSSFSQARTITLNAGGGTLDVDSAQTLTQNGAISGAGALTKTGTGTLVLSGAKTNSGLVNLNGGTVTVSAANNLGDSGASNDLAFDGGTLEVTSSFASARDITLGAGDGAFNLNGIGTIYTQSAGSVMSGSGDLIVTGTGVLTLNGTNTNSGGIIVQSGAVNGDSNAAFGDASGTNNITLAGGNLRWAAAYEQTRDVTLTANSLLDLGGFAGSELSGNISGTSDLTIAAGSLILSGTNTNSGKIILGNNALATTVIASASNNLGDSGATNDLEFLDATFEYGAAFDQTRDVALTGAGTIDTGTFSSTITGVLSGSGTLTKDGSGTLTLAGTHTHTGDIDIAAGELVLDEDIDRTYNGNISGSGDFTKSGDSQLILNGANTFSGAVTINDGSLRVGTSARLGDGSVTNTIAINNGAILSAAGTFTNARDIDIGTGGAEVEVTAGQTLTQTGQLSGATSLTKTGTGTLVLDADNSGYTGTTYLIGGVLAVSDMDDLGTPVGGNHVDFDGGTLRFDAAFNWARGSVLTGAATMNTNGNDVEVSGDLDGTGALTKSGTGILSLTGMNTNFSGNLAISAGAVDFDEIADRTYNGVISGAGDLVKSGTTKLTLGGNNTMTGDVSVDGGTLSVNGTLDDVNAITVGNTGTLGGTGTVGPVTVQNGGTLAAGNSIGQMDVTGNLDFNNGANFDVEYDPASADRVDVDGAVTINAGATLNLLGLGGTYGQTVGPYIILTATGGVTGMFGTVTNDLAFLDEDVDYNANDIQVSFTRNDVGFDDIAQDEDQAQVAQAVEDLGNGNDVYDAFVGLTDAQAVDALEQLSGEHNAGVAGAMAESAGMIQNTITSHMTGLSHGSSIGDMSALGHENADQSVYVAALMEPAAGPVTQNINLWIETIGSFGSSDSHKTAPAQDRHSYGILGGVDVPFDDAGYFGFFGGYERGEVETDSQRASSDLNNYHVGAFATRPIGDGWRASGGVGASYHDINSVRYVVFPGFSGAPEGDTNGYTAIGFAEVAKPIQFENIAVESFFSASVTHSHMNGYTETNGNGAEVVVDDVTKTTPSTVLGIRMGKEMMTGEDSEVNLNASLGWQHNFGELENEATMRFAAGTTTFDSNGPARSRDAAVVGIGVDATIAPGANAYAGYNGTLSTRAQDHGFKAGLKVEF